MTGSLNPDRILLANLLLKLYRDEITGVVTVKDNRRTLRICLRGGHIVYADGIDKDSQLLKEIASRKGLSSDRLRELQDIKEKDPQSLGKTLIGRKIIAQSVWDRFVLLKVKSILAAALDMANPDLDFSKSELNIPPLNSIDYNIVQLLLDTIRGIRNLDRLKKNIPDDEAVFAPSGEAEDLKQGIPLTPSEESIFSAVDGEMTVREIMDVTRQSREVVYRGLYLLLCFGLIRVLTEEERRGGGSPDYTEIIRLYLDLLGILEGNFQKEVGREFDNIFKRCKEQLTGESRDLFHDLALSRDAQMGVAEVIARRFEGQSRTEEGRLILLSAFNQLVYLLVMQMKKVLGEGLAERTLKDMMKILAYVEKYREDTKLMNYVSGNLQDYLRQIRS